MSETDKTSKLAWITIFVAALGYFVDVFDMWLFANFRIQSLTDLGFDEHGVTNYGALLMNCQQAGFLIGGIIWGVLGDKKGRASVMFGSIFLYSIGNILNSYVTNIEQYAVLRFITGLGLAGEIGAGITLVCEILPKNKRGIGTTIVTTIGVAGAVAAALAGKHLEWRSAFFIGGIMGLCLLILRIITHESGMFNKMCETEGIKKGSIKLLFSSKERILRFLSCIVIGFPIYTVLGVMATFGPEIAKAIKLSEIPTVPDVMLYSSIGITLGDLFAGVLSQKMKSRKKPLIIFLSVLSLLSLVLISEQIKSKDTFLIIFGLLGLFSGYWACLITTAAEQFGTNLRATVTTIVPNLVRGSAIISISCFVYLKDLYEIKLALTAVVAGTFVLAFAGLIYLKESFHKDLNFFET